MTETKWLSQDEQRAWRGFLLASRLVMDRLGRELSESHDLSLTDYGILVRLSEEGDRRFQRVRRKILLDFAEALAAAMEAFQPAADRPYPPLAAAGGLVSMLAHVGSYEADFPSWGMPIEGIRTYMAHVLAQTILGTMHPSAHPALDSL